MPIVQSRRVQPLFTFFHTLCVLIALLLFGCQSIPGKKRRGLQQGQQQHPNMAPAQLPVGTIHMVDPQGKYVLIQSSRFLPVEPGASITTVSVDGIETSELKVSPARKGQFLTADIMSGRPGVGDRAVMVHLPKVPSPEVDPNTPNTGGSTDNEIQVLE